MKVFRLMTAAPLVVAALMGGCAQVESSPSAFAGDNRSNAGVIEIIHGDSASDITGPFGGAATDSANAKRGRAESRYHIQVRMDSGDRVIVSQDSTYGLRVGDRVRIENDHAYSYNEHFRERR